jgi:hypothetical protein
VAARRSTVFDRVVEQVYQQITGQARDVRHLTADDPPNDGARVIVRAQAVERTDRVPYGSERSPQLVRQGGKQAVSHEGLLAVSDAVRSEALVADRIARASDAIVPALAALIPDRPR